ncbi:MAG: response regulator transcription factor [Dinghuibacter sp.]|nr:response regulator transcription factor [Dinghuibacter sp.]
MVKPDLIINCVVLDDEQHAIEVLVSHIKETPALHLVCATTSPQEAAMVVNSEAVDLVLLDIQMPRITGIDFLSIIRERCHIIFCSAYAEYAIQGFEHDVVDFLLKPIGYGRFLKAIGKVQKLVQEALEMVITENDTPDYMFVKNGVKGKSLKVSFNELQYVEAQKNYVVFHQLTGKIITYMSISEAAQKLPAKYFMRVHRSFIVRLDQIVAIEGNTIRVKDCKEAIPIGEHYKQDLVQTLGIE